MGLIILAIIMCMIGAIMLYVSIMENKDHLDFLGCIFIAIGTLIILFGIDKSEYKINLPEEIYQSRQGDTLYITKRTKDSIYLGFKPIKE